jgi:hypothetical protein
VALQDNVVFAHFGDALTEDSPGDATQTNPSGTTNPGVSGGSLTFSGSQAITYDFGADDWAVGTGDFSIAIRATITTLTSSSDVLIHLGDSSSFTNELQIQVDDASNGIIELIESYNNSNPGVDTTSSFASNGTAFTLVVVRDTNVFALYDGAGNDVLGSDGLGSSYNVTSSQYVTLGSEYDGTRTLDGSIDWVVVWDRALTSSEISNNMNETDLKAAILTSAIIVPVPTGPLR